MKKIIIIAACILSAAGANAKNISYKNVPIDKNPATLKENLIKAKIEYLETQANTVYFQDRFAGMDCMLQFPWDKKPQKEMYFSVIFGSRTEWKDLEKDYDKVYRTLYKSYGKPNEETYSFLHSGITQDYDEIEELCKGRCDYFARWHLDDGVVVVELATSAENECFVLITYTKL